MNYNVYEDFEFFGADNIYGWTTSGTVNAENKQLNLSSGSTATKTFEKADGTVCTETYFYSKNGDDFDIAIGNDYHFQVVVDMLYFGYNLKIILKGQGLCIRKKIVGNLLWKRTLS